MIDRILRLLLGPRDGEPQQLDPNGLVVVASSHGEPEALMLQELLKNDGVHAMVRGRAWVPTGMSLGGPYDIVVLRKDASKAREILPAPPPDAVGLGIWFPGGPPP